MRGVALHEEYWLPFRCEECTNVVTQIYGLCLLKDCVSNGGATGDISLGQRPGVTV